jgi:hypothetical protein
MTTGPACVDSAGMHGAVLGLIFGKCGAVMTQVLTRSHVAGFTFGFDFHTLLHRVAQAAEDFDIVLCAQSLDGVDVLVGKAVHLNEVVGEAAGVKLVESMIRG